jgi:hypothetical protein
MKKYVRISYGDDFFIAKKNNKNYGKFKIIFVSPNISHWTVGTILYLDPIKDGFGTKREELTEDEVKIEVI